MKRIVYLHLILLVAVCVYGEAKTMARDTQGAAQIRKVTSPVGTTDASAGLSIQAVSDGERFRNQFGQIPAAALALPWTLLIALACCWPKQGLAEDQPKGLRNQCFPVGWE
jgi:hypothetical protein